MYRIYYWWHADSDSLWGSTKLSENLYNYGDVVKLSQADALEVQKQLGLDEIPIIDE